MYLELPICFVAWKGSKICYKRTPIISILQGYLHALRNISIFSPYFAKNAFIAGIATNDG
jgi:hypothetical protein